MNNTIKIPEVVKQINLRGILRIDYALEGDWDNTVKVIWRKGEENMDLSDIIKVHTKYEPTIELFFEDYFIGIMCYKKTEAGYEFDEIKANEIFNHVKRDQTMPNIS